MISYTYDIQGMSCGSCRQKVEDVLNDVDGITNASVSLELKEVYIVMEQKLDIQILKNVIPDKYTLTEKEMNGVIESSNQAIIEKSKLQQLSPLFLILGYITIGAIMHNYNDWSVDNFMLDFMGLFYIVFSFFKMLDLRGFSTSFRMYDPLAKVVSLYSRIYPFIEIGLGILFLMRFKINMALILTVCVLGITTIGVTKALIDRKNIQCACLGTVLKLPMTTATFVENSIMLMMAIWMLLKIYT